MAYYLSNSSSEVVSACLEVYDASCAGTGRPFRKVAWYNMAPGQTIIPDTFNYPLTKGNQYSALYAYSGSRDYQSTVAGYHIHVVVPGGFSQCVRNDTNCNRYVDFFPIDFGGANTVITYIGHPVTIGVPAEIITTSPKLFFQIWGGYIILFGSGFSANATVNVIGKWESPGNTGQNPGTMKADGGGNFQGSLALNTSYVGTILAAATDSVFPELTASATMANS